MTNSNVISLIIAQHNKKQTICRYIDRSKRTNKNIRLPKRWYFAANDKHRFGVYVFRCAKINIFSFRNLFSTHLQNRRNVHAPMCFLQYISLGTRWTSIFSVKMFELNKTANRKNHRRAKNMSWLTFDYIFKCLVVDHLSFLSQFKFNYFLLLPGRSKTNRR